MKALRLEFFRTLRTTMARFFSILLIVTLGVAFFFGVRSSKPDMKASADSYYDGAKFMDLRIVNPDGMTEKDLARIRDTEGVSSACGFYSKEMLCMRGQQQDVIRVMSIQEDMNQVTLVEGRLPKNDRECVIDVTMSGKNQKIGDLIQFQSGDLIPVEKIFSNKEYTITGYVKSPWYTSLDRGSATIGNGSMKGFVYVLPKAFVLPVYTEIDVRVSKADSKVCYSSSYKKLVNGTADRLKKQEKGWTVLDRETLQVYVEYEQDTDRIGAIGVVFPVIFFFVAALVSLTTMTRMVEEERTQIGTLKALGYSKRAIAGKYVLYAFSASVFGSILGVMLGQTVLPYVIIKAYAILYVNITEIKLELNISYALTASIVAIVCTTAATVAACYREMLSVPASLMRPQAPKNGSRVLLEHITPLWKRIPFSLKASIRNLLRYKKRFFMTIIGIGGCTALILVGFGLKDSISQMGKRQFSRVLIYDAEIILNENGNRGELEQKIKADEDVLHYMYVQQNAFDAVKDGVRKGVYVIIPKEKDQFKNYISIQDRITAEHYELDDDGVIITEKLASMLNVKCGDEIELTNDTFGCVKVPVSEITENYFRNFVYLSAKAYEKYFKEEPEYNEMFLVNRQKEETFEKAFHEKYAGYSAASVISFTSGISGRIDNMLRSMDGVIVVLVVSAGLLSFIVLYNLNNINITERMRELATLKVLGFYDEEVAVYVYRENIWLTIIGTAVGLLLGIGLHRFVIITAEIDMLMFGRKILLSSYLYSILLTIIFAVFVNLAMLRRLRRIQMTESFKSVE